MSIQSTVARKKVLVIDDQVGMRNQLQQSLTHAGFEKLHVVGSIRDALARMDAEKYDLILCDYFLGDSTNGQQFLEFLRTRNRISRNTLYVIITAESGYENVVLASECAPDDYLLKPFTAEMLNSRLARLLERQDHFAVLDKAYDASDWRRVLAESDRLMAARDKYFVDLCRIQGGALMRLNRPEEAARLYQQVLAMRPLPWAKLGYARAQAALGATEDAQKIARELLRDHPQFMAAYDFLSGLLDGAGQKEEALDVLKQARGISPGTMSRIRTLSHLAVDTGDAALAEEVMSSALKQHRYSPVREAGDYSVLSRALSEQGNPAQALEVLKEAKSSFKGESDVALLAASESLAHRKAGNETAAQQALQQALAADASALPPGAAALVAQACFAAGDEVRAQALLKQMVQNNPDDTAVHGRVKQVFAEAGKDAAAAGEMIETSTREVIQINNDGVRKAEAGELAEAISLLTAAADRLPNNLQIVGNAALALALDLVRNGRDPAKLQACLRYRQRVQERDPAYPKLAQVDALLKKATQT